jgi:hypothetical protein
MKTVKLLPVLGLALLLTGCGTDAESKETITLYKSYTCGCCKGWKEHMVSNGYKIKVVNLDDKDLPAIKSKYRIPRSVMSCHTAVIGDYVVEGHVPSAIVDNLLAEKPAIDGIAMVGMPSGSPGMPGPKNELWRIYSIKDGQVSLYAEI